MVSCGGITGRGARWSSWLQKRHTIALCLPRGYIGLSRAMLGQVLSGPVPQSVSIPAPHSVISDLPRRRGAVRRRREENRRQCLVLVRFRWPLMIQQYIYSRVKSSQEHTDSQFDSIGSTFPPHGFQTPSFKHARRYMKRRDPGMFRIAPCVSPSTSASCSQWHTGTRAKHVHQ